MSISSLKRFLIAALLLACSAPAFAQQPSRPLTGGNDQNILVGLGVTFMNVSEETGVGFNANALFNAFSSSDRGKLGIAGDFGVNSFDGGTLVTIMGGPRYTFQTSGKAVPYAQFLVGLATCCGDTDFVPSIGFGLDYAFRPNVNLRGELSFIFDDANATRFFLGISLPIAK